LTFDFSFDFDLLLTWSFVADLEITSVFLDELDFKISILSWPLFLFKNLSINELLSYFEVKDFISVDLFSILFDLVIKFISDFFIFDTFSIFFLLIDFSVFFSFISQKLILSYISLYCL
jgi:hypothetical protein